MAQWTGDWHATESLCDAIENLLDSLGNSLLEKSESEILTQALYSGDFEDGMFLLNEWDEGQWGQNRSGIVDLRETLKSQIQRIKQAADNHPSYLSFLSMEFAFSWF